MPRPARTIDERRPAPAQVPAPATAQVPAPGQMRSQPADDINANTAMILTTGSGLTYQPLAADLATVLNDGDNLRVLPVQGYSAYQNVRDLCYLRGIDLAFTRTNILNRWRQRGEIPDLDQKVVYILKVANAEENIIARSDITSVEQLRGKKVNFNLAGSGTQMSARDIFGALGVEVEETNFGVSDGLQKLQDGEIAAVVMTAGKPSPLLRRLKRSDGYRVLPIPLTTSLIGDYAPSTLEHDDARKRHPHHCLQLAEGLRPLPASRQVRRFAVSASGGAANAATPRQMERHDLGRQGLGMETLRGRGGVAQER
jgi:uncharacterized protein